MEKENEAIWGLLIEVGFGDAAAGRGPVQHQLSAGSCVRSCVGISISNLNLSLKMIIVREMGPPRTMVRDAFLFFSSSAARRGFLGFSNWKKREA